MASVPGHPFWITLVEDMMNVATHNWCRKGDGTIDILSSTGPRRLDRVALHSGQYKVRQRRVGEWKSEEVWISPHRPEF